MKRTADERFLLLGSVLGMLAGVLLLVRLVVGTAFLRPLEGWTEDTEGALRVVSANEGAFLATGILAIVASVFMVPFLIAVYQALRMTGGRLALLGTVLGVSGATVLTMTVLGSLLMSFTFASQYEAATDPAGVLIAAEVMGDAVGAGIITSTAFLCAAFVSLGFAIRTGTAWGRRPGLFLLVLGAIIPIGIVLRTLGPFTVASSLPPLLFLFFLPLGWKIYRSAQSQQATGTSPGAREEGRL